ncbi:hypothetical protein EZV62_015431 [Acer yangbiense]|uniref:Uncharacterized protein n=1 Tax=Acer yangbiense TaxID=1000413 RepID=A0A5C7HMJ8_9ROSI|nr:hypothetical protein EZV62_015431 [Acer yangbiense]
MIANAEKLQELEAKNVMVRTRNAKLRAIVEGMPNNIQANDAMQNDGGAANNMLVISNLALVVAGMEDCKWFEAIYKACLLRKGNHSMALLVAFPTNLGFAAIDGLFRFQVLQVYHSLGRLSATLALEGVLIAYLYSILT